MKIFVKVKTGAKEEKIEKTGENNYVVSVKERPKKGLANKAVIKSLSRYFKVSQKNVVIVSGFSSRQKLIKIHGNRIRKDIFIKERTRESKGL